MRKTQKSGPSVWAASSVSEPGSPHDTKELNRRKPHLPIFNPADSRPDATGENDWAFFKSRPLLHTRIRVAFPGEFPREILKQGRGRMAVVIVAVERDAAGQPIRRARGVLFPEGGRA